MIGNRSVLAIVTARGGSKGLPRKNVLPLGGKPLVTYPIAAAQSSSAVDRLIISTDDREIAEIGEAAGAEAPFMRPSALATDTASSIDVVLHALDTLEGHGTVYDYVVLLEPTSPLTQGRDIDVALERLNASRDIADAIVGVVAVQQAHPAFCVAIKEGGCIAPIGAQTFVSMRRQEISAVYALSGVLYGSDVGALRSTRSFVHGRTLPYVVPRWKSFEIDERLDITLVEAILHQLRTSSGSQDLEIGG